MERETEAVSDVQPASFAGESGPPDAAGPPAPANPAAHGPSQAALIVGIFALVCNVTLIFALFGIVLGIVAVILGAANLQRHRHAKAGFVLGFLSFVPPAAYLLTAVAIIRSDPILF